MYVCVFCTNDLYIECLKIDKSVYTRLYAVNAKQ